MAKKSLSGSDFRAPILLDGSAGTAGQFLKSNGNTTPSWKELDLSDLPTAAFKKSARVGTTANITLSAPQTIDGVAVVANDRVLVKNQTAAAENGIYIVQAAAWTRADDANSAADMGGAVVNINEGTQGGQLWTTSFKTTDTVGTTAMNWFRIQDASRDVPLADGGTNASLTAANGGVVYSTASAMAISAVGTSGQVLKSNGAAAPTWQTLDLSYLPDAAFKKSVRAATTANITLSGTQTIDGIAVVAGDRILVKNQTTASTNGIYDVAAGAWTRSADADSASEMGGAIVNVDSGTQGAQLWTTSFKTTDTIGTTNMVWYRVVDTSYTIPVSQGGTGATAAKAARTNLATPTLTSSDTAPTAGNSNAGDLWLDTADGTLYVYFTDANTSQWVQVQANSALEGTILSRLGGVESRATALENSFPVSITDGGTGATTLAEAQNSLGIGLSPVIPPTVLLTPPGGSATANSVGEVSFTNVTSISLNNVFTSTYRNYRVVVSFSSSTANGSFLGIRLRAAGTDVSSASYTSNVGNWSAGSWATSQLTGQTLIRLVISDNQTTLKASGSFEIANPNVAATTSLHGTFSAYVGGIFSGLLETTAQYDGFTLLMASGVAFTGTVQIFGYNS